MRSILLHIHDDRCLEARLQVAIDLARCFNAHLTCLQVKPFVFSVPGDFYGSLIAEMLPVMNEHAEKLGSRLKNRLAQEDVAWEWIHEQGIAHDYLLRHSQLSDLTVVGACDPETGAQGPSHMAAELAIRSRTPVLIVPEMVRSFDVAGPAVVAWNGSREAAHSLKAALPLLARSQSVTLLTVEEGGEEAQDLLPPLEGAEYLSRHGINCKLTQLPIQDSSVARAIVGAAQSRKASYLVMGAYGRSRLAEAIFGGVTRDLLSAPPLPIITCN